MRRVTTARQAMSASRAVEGESPEGDYGTAGTTGATGNERTGRKAEVTSHVNAKEPAHMRRLFRFCRPGELLGAPS
jgi:hypothetical protein